MKIGIEANVCRKTKCEHYKNDSMWCKLIKCGSAKLSCYGCPLPENCPNKTLHIIEGRKEYICYGRKECIELCYGRKVR